MSDLEGLEILLEHLKLERGFDFTGYKRSTLERRVQRRLDAVGVADFLAYRDYLEVTPGEFPQLFNTILINVTGFFRDPAAWDRIADTVVPALVAAKGPNEPIRIWSAGCASGQEPFTVAMVLIEALGEAAFKERVKIYATDVDDEALEEARAATFTHDQVQDVPAELRERCFEPVDTRLCFRKDLRRQIIFGRNDLVSDAPISRVDLLLCRNTLMYFNVETQARILGRFNFALLPDGYLFMGRSEMLITHGDLFKPVDVKARIFARVPRGSVGDRAFLTRPRREPRAAATVLDDSLLGLIHETAPLAHLVVGADGTLTLANRAARDLTGLSGSDVGRRFQDLDISYRPLDLRTPLDHVFAEGEETKLEPVELPGTGGGRLVAVTIVPVKDAEGMVVAGSVSLEDVTTPARLQRELDDSQRELEHSYEELQSTVEELETTNEELQSTNEELETTNEELQSSNQELETMNEELQSTNEELETLNDDLRQRTDELDDVNAFLEAILTALQLAVIVVDDSLRVQVWNGVSVELWGVQAGEVIGKPLLSIDIGLPFDDLKGPLRQVLDGDTERAELTLDAVNRRGRPITCAITMSRLLGDDRSGHGAVIVLEPSEAPASL